MNRRLRSMVVSYLLKTGHIERNPGGGFSPSYNCLDCGYFMSNKGRILPHFVHTVSHREIYRSAVRRFELLAEAQ